VSEETVLVALVPDFVLLVSDQASILRRAPHFLLAPASALQLLIARPSPPPFSYSTRGSPFRPSLRPQPAPLPNPPHPMYTSPTRADGRSPNLSQPKPMPGRSSPRRCCMETRVGSTIPWLFSVAGLGLRGLGLGSARAWRLSLRALLRSDPDSEADRDET
jgi:hypothetical protein